MLTMSSTSRITDCVALLSLSTSAPVPPSTTIPHCCCSADGDWSTVKLPATASSSTCSSAASGRARAAPSSSAPGSPSASSLCRLPRIESSALASSKASVDPSCRWNVERYTVRSSTGSTGAAAATHNPISSTYNIGGRAPRVIYSTRVFRFEGSGTYIQKMCPRHFPSTVW